MTIAPERVVSMRALASLWHVAESEIVIVDLNHDIRDHGVKPCQNNHAAIARARHHDTCMA